MQINGPVQRPVDLSAAKEDNKHEPAESDSFSQEGCEQQNQTSGFAGNDNYRRDEQDDEYDAEADDQDPDDLKVYPKKADDQPENLTFQGRFEDKVPADSDHSDADNEINAIQSDAEKSAKFQPERESGRDTADLVTHSELAK